MSYVDTRIILGWLVNRANYIFKYLRLSLELTTSHTQTNQHKMTPHVLYFTYGIQRNHRKPRYSHCYLSPHTRYQVHLQRHSGSEIRDRNRSASSKRHRRTASYLAIPYAHDPERHRHKRYHLDRTQIPHWLKPIGKENPRKGVSFCAFTTINTYCRAELLIHQNRYTQINVLERRK